MRSLICEEFSKNCNLEKVETLPSSAADADESNYDYYKDFHSLEEVPYREGKRSPNTLATTLEKEARMTNRMHPWRLQFHRNCAQKLKSVITRVLRQLIVWMLVSPLSIQEYQVAPKSLAGLVCLAGQ